MTTSSIVIDPLVQHGSQVRDRPAGTRGTTPDRTSGPPRNLPLISSVNRSNFGLTPGTQPIRGGPRRRGGSSWSGYFSSGKALGPAPFESLLERHLMTLVSVDPRVKCFAVQPHELLFWMPGPDGNPIKRRYVPDLVAQTWDGDILVLEAKASIYAEGAVWSCRVPFIREAYRLDHAATHLVFTEREICAEPRLTNAQIIHSYRGPPEDPEAVLIMRQVIDDACCEVLLGQLEILGEEQGLDSRRCRSALMRLVSEGVLDLDLSGPISPSSRVTLKGRGQ